ncbi:MAG TPA: DUF2071 domain-containing protein [Candidatus Angelobacter sp.]|nr:DUF2071 domain-containing protein [Candidatus Angelobacter sp.]
MLPILRGLIARRALLNFRADVDTVQALLPKPFEVEPYQGRAIVGVCLIRLEELRPKGFPAGLGMASENMAHRVAVRYPTDGRMETGVFVWRRETDQQLVRMFGGRLFPGVHQGARFRVQENEDDIAMEVTSAEGETDVSSSASCGPAWQPTSAFKNLDEASEFFQHGDCGFSCSRDGGSVEGMQLKILQWSPQPLTVGSIKSAFYSNPDRFPPGSIEFDCGLIMHAAPHERHEIRDVPELEAVSNFA